MKRKGLRNDDALVKYGFDAKYEKAVEVLI